MTKDVQRANRVDQFFAQHQANLARQGAVVSSWRVRGGRRAGPFFRLECRLPSGTKIAVYLGSAGPLVTAVRTRLAELRHPVRQSRQLAKVHRHLRRDARAARVNSAPELAKSGMYWKGSEIRGASRRKLVDLLAATLADPAAVKAQKLEK